MSNGFVFEPTKCDTFIFPLYSVLKFQWHLKNIYLFIWLHWVLVVARGIFSVCGGI